MRTVTAARCYPAARVIVGFSAAPSLTGVLLVLSDMAFALLTGRALETAPTYIGLVLLAVGFGFLFYGLPAAMIGVFCVLSRFSRKVGVLAGLMLLAAAVGYGWGLLIASLMDYDRVIPTLPGLGSASPAILAACSVLLMGLLVLPKRFQDDQ